MVKVNLLKKGEPAKEEFSPEEENSVETPEPAKKEKPKKKGGNLKLILLILMVGAIGGSGYLAYLQGWFSGGDKTTPPDTMVVADETPMDSPKEDKIAEKSVKKPPTKKPATVKTTITTKPSQSKVKPGRPAKKSPDKAVQKRGNQLTQVIEGRILLDVFSSIISSVNDGMSDMKLTVSRSGVTLALGMNSREEAALLLRKIREKWPMSNLRAARFERSNSVSEYAYATQFSGSVLFKGRVPESSEKKKSLLKTKPFKTRLTTLIAAHGLKLVRFKASSKVQMRGSSSIPITITANGSKDSISKFIDSFAKLNVAYGLSRASILSQDSASATVSLYLNLIMSNNKALS